MDELVGIFKALSDTTRLRIVKLLEQGELCVCDLVAALDQVQPKVSFHLGVLKEAGFIRDRKQGRWTRYRLNDNDLFRRMLLFSACERIADVTVGDERKRLSCFLGSKNAKGKNGSMIDPLPHIVGNRRGGPASRRASRSERPMRHTGQ